MLRTSEIIVPKGKLTLVPMMPMACLGSKLTPCSFGKIKVGANSFDIYGSRVPSINEDNEDLSSKFNVAYFWVYGASSITTDESLANMAADHIGVNGIKIPVLKNIKAIKPFTQLMIFKAAEPARTSTLKRLMKFQQDVQAAGEVGQPAAKKVPYQKVATK